MAGAQGTVGARATLRAVRAVYLTLVAATAAFVASIAGATPIEGTGASAFAFRLSVPGQPVVAVLEVAAPPATKSELAGFSYPTDGSLLRAASLSASGVSQAGASASAQGAAGATSLVLFGGEITADLVSARVTTAAGAANQTADVSSSAISGLVVLGRPITVTPGLQLPLADWGTLELLAAATTTPTTETSKVISAEVVALRVRVSAPHATLVPGTVLEVGVAGAIATAEPPEPTPPPAPVTSEKPAGSTFRGRPGAAAAIVKEPGSSIPGAPADLVRQAPAGVVARFSSEGYVFPVYGPASFGDTFGAPRADVAGGWHHGEDIFAPEGTPLLAVADGSVFSVGWNDIGGWRLWLRDAQGNEFYYAHLSAYSPLAVDGTAVKAGDVLGFMGKTGDAEASLPHLHFEIHPVALLSLGYDGAIAPYPYLLAWRRAQDVSFSAGRIYTPQAGGDGRPVRGAATPSGAILLQATDISRTSGLVQGAPAQALAGRGSTGASPTGP
jgi:murein DD-endopeptidase MepM/ murein hydrolase activator NlpD